MTTVKLQNINKGIELDLRFQVHFESELKLKRNALKLPKLKTKMRKLKSTTCLVAKSASLINGDVMNKLKNGPAN